MSTMSTTHPVTTPPAPPIGELLTTQEAAALLRVSADSLVADRCQRRWGVPFLRMGKRVLYDKAAVLRWLAERNGLGGGDA